MSRNHPALQRFNHKLGGMSTKNMGRTVDGAAIEADVQAGAARAEAAIAEASRRIYHPAIKAPEHKCFRVIRRWKGQEYGEDIGFASLACEALRIMNAELGWAIVIAPSGKRFSYNYQPMTVRP